MARAAILIGVFSLCVRCMGNPIATVAEVTNVQMTESVYARIDATDQSSPDRLFLSFLKVCAAGDLSGVLRLFTDSCLLDDFATESRSVTSSEADDRNLANCVVE